jgi:hypothetical protein
VSWAGDFISGYAAAFNAAAASGDFAPAGMLDLTVNDDLISRMTVILG